MCGRPNTTIGFERLYNPLARLERDPFVSAVEAGVPPRPLNMTAIEATNRGLIDASWAMLRSAPKVQQVDIEALEKHAPETVVLDVREPEEYAHGHVPGAVNVPQAEIASRLDEIPRDRPLIIVCQAGYRSLRAAQFLRQVGFDRVTSVTGGMEAWEASDLPVAFGDTSVELPRITESEWAHAGAGSL
jgi:rhodanese-related sulfurtransferase